MPAGRVRARIVRFRSWCGPCLWQVLCDHEMKRTQPRADLFGDITFDARRRAQDSWRRNKGPMAVYWKAVGAYAWHIRRALRRSSPEQSS
jgi:hypothetical protein